MKKIYRSRYTWWIVAIFVAFMLLLPIIMFFEGFNLLCAIFAILYIAFGLDLLCRTSYRIEGTRLRLRAGMFSATLDIDKMVSISRKNSFTNGNSFAWSTNRLALRMPRRYVYEVSPADEQSFIADLLLINPNIAVL